MKVNKFMTFFNQELKISSNPFIENLKDEDMDLHEWANTLIAWMELSTEEDARRYYGDYYDQ